VRRIAAYGLCRDEHGRVLLVRASSKSANAGRWFLPGGGLHHGEHPTDALVREVREETGLTVEVVGLQDVITDVERLPDGDVRHQDRLIFRVRAARGRLRDEPDGSTDRAAWIAAQELADLPLMPHVARVLDIAMVDGSDPDVGPLAPDPVRTSTGAVPRRFQRFAAYGLVTDPTGLILLTLIAEGYPGTGLWHLPGGGTDFGEPAADGLLRELVEETGQHGRITAVVGVSHRRHDRALGPEGVPIDWHGVRVVFAATVDRPTPPQVIEQAGSTAAAAWFTRREALGLALTEVAREMITIHTSEPGERAG
jgi:ADP-ribose pyrophosphatase YjhB (NUDIX family)